MGRYIYMKRVLLAVAVLLLVQPGPVFAREAFRIGLNHKRDQLGLHELRANRQLVRKARAHAEQMASAGRISHAGFTARTRYDGLRDHGEVVAFTGGVVAQPRRVLGLYLASPHHRAILLKPQSRLIGTAAVRRHGRVYWCTLTARP